MGGQAFDAPRAQIFYLDPNKVVIIGLDTKDGPEHRLYDPRVKLPVLEEQLANVRKHKILEAGLISKEKLPGGETRDVVVDGRQRTRWARAVNLEIREECSSDEDYEKRMVRVPFILKSQGDKAALKSMGTAANMRAESNILTKALDVQGMLDSGHHNKHDIAVDLGVTVQAVDSWLQVLTLGKKMQDAVRNGVMAPSAAIQYSDVSEEEQDKALADAERLGIRISTPEAKTQRAARKRSNGANGHDVRRPVGGAVMRKIVADEEFMENVSSDVTNFAHFVATGDVNFLRRIKGGMAMGRRIGYLGKDEE